MLKIRIVLALACIFSIVPRVYAWNGTGHMTVAYIGYKKLDKSTRKRVDALLKLNPNYRQWTTGVAEQQRGLVAFLNAATWPDCIKGSSCPGYISDGPKGGNSPPPGPEASQNVGYSDKAMHKYWHYTDSPFAVGGVATEPSPIPNAETQLPVLIAALASNAPDELKSYDLTWITHIVGDLHQPLHTTARFTVVSPHGDDGGNGVKFCVDPCRDNLHSFWDGLLGINIAPKVITALGEKLLKNPKPAGRHQLAVGVWIQEGFALAQSHVYKAPISEGENSAEPLSPRPDSAYEAAAKKLADSQVLLAGYRLAGVLNANLR